MRYYWLRASPPAKEDRRRLRIGFLLWLIHGMRLPTDAVRWIGPFFGSRRARELALRLGRLIRDPAANYDEKVLQWLMAYGKPALIRELIGNLQGTEPEAWELCALRDADPGHLLAMDYRTPDFQYRQFSAAAPRSILICVTSSALRIGSSVQVMNALVAPRFDAVIYLRDHRKQYFKYGIAGICDTLDGIAPALRPYIPASCHVGVVSGSSGGLAGARIAAALDADRAALMGAPFEFGELTAIDPERPLSPERLRLYYARRSKLDQRWSAMWAATPLAGAIRWVDSDSHAVVQPLAKAGRWEAILDWLAGRAVDPSLILDEPLSRLAGKA